MSLLRRAAPIAALGLLGVAGLGLVAVDVLYWTFVGGPLGAPETLGPLTPPFAVRMVGLNFVAGWLYLRESLDAAMLGHAARRAVGCGAARAGPIRTHRTWFSRSAKLPVSATRARLRARMSARRR